MRRRARTATSQDPERTHADDEAGKPGVVADLMALLDLDAQVGDDAHVDHKAVRHQKCRIDPRPTPACHVHRVPPSQAMRPLVTHS